MWISWYVAICLLAIGHGNTQITQSPSLVVREGKMVQLLCSQMFGHDVMFWYRQDGGQRLELLFHYYYENLQGSDKPGNVRERFRPEKPKKEICNLNISSAKPEDSAVYFCASSKRGDYSEVHFGKGTRLTVLVCDGGTAEAKETYLRTANFGKLVYILLIFKSILYGAFVMGLKLWKKPLLKKPFA